jgi:protease-4
MDTTKKSSGSKWFWGIFISLILIVLIFVGITFLIFTKSITTLSFKSDKSYEYVSEGDSKGKVAIVELNYTIISSESIVRQFKKFREDESIKAIVLRINTPGGGVAASQEMYEEVRKTRDSGKPVIVSFGSIAASGGYYVSCGGSLIVSNPGSLTGSIGVIAQFITIKELAEKLGINATTVKSGDLKDAGNMFREPNEADIEYLQDIIDNSFQQFLDVVSRERKIDMEELKKIATGRVFTGMQALELGLVDTLGTFEDAIQIAADIGGIEGEPTIVKEKKKMAWLDYLMESSTNSEIRELKEDFKNEFLEKPILQYKYEK